MTRERIRLGISACLLGQPVRFDGGHKRIHSLWNHSDSSWNGCPCARKSNPDWSRLVNRCGSFRSMGEIRLLTNKTGLDRTELLRGYARPPDRGTGRW